LDQILDLVAEHRQKLAILASTVAVVLMALSVANAVLFVIDNLDDSTTSKAGASSPAVQTRPGNSVNVASLNLFGVAEAEDAPRVIDAPQTSLNLELQGVFTAADPDESTAIVAERNKAGELYQIGVRRPYPDKAWRKAREADVQRRTSAPAILTQPGFTQPEYGNLVTAFVDSPAEPAGAH
jgi:hypothetical protein